VMSDSSFSSSFLNHGLRDLGDMVLPLLFPMVDCLGITAAKAAIPRGVTIRVISQLWLSHEGGESHKSLNPWLFYYMRKLYI
ncbi:MAG: hypothetical protein IJT98_04385, partial [Prevotella sp.]|nr:hypothetical protein [Prevotella sp.]